MNRFGSKVKESLNFVAENSSIPGLRWWAKLKSFRLKIFFHFLMCLTVWPIVAFVIVRAIDFCEEKQHRVSTTHSMGTHNERPYPNLTICHPKFLNYQTIKGKMYLFNNS